MALGPHIPEWQRLHDRLTKLTTDAGAISACIFDAWGLPWCCAPVHKIGVARGGRLILERAIWTLPKPLQQGGSLDLLCRAPLAGVAYVRSFASVYVLILQYAAPFDLKRAKRLTEEALPLIEALVVALPPPHGSGSGSAEALNRA